MNTNTCTEKNFVEQRLNNVFNHPDKLDVVIGLIDPCLGKTSATGFKPLKKEPNLSDDSNMEVASRRAMTYRKTNIKIF